jgi:hypothetical protein
MPTILFQLSDLTTTTGGTVAAVIPAAAMSVRQLGTIYAPTALYPSERGTAFYPDILAPIYQPAEAVIEGGSESVFEYLYAGKANGTNGFRLSLKGGRQITQTQVPTGGVQQCQQICESELACNGFFLGAAGDCHTVNATNVAVGTSLVGVSYRRKRIGIDLVANVTRSIWIDITIPSSVAAGVYTGTVSVTQLQPAKVGGST